MTISQTPLLATGDIFHVYADGQNGDDKNTGFDETAPKKTTSSALSAFPDFIDHDCCLHLKNTFETSLANNLVFDKWIRITKTFIIDGGDELNIISGPHTADISSTKTIGLSTAGWTPDEHQGKWIEITSGVCDGQIRRVYGNTATTLQASRQFSENPDNATFNIVVPKTCIGNDTGATALDIIPFPRGGGKLKVQRLRFNDDNVQLKAEGGSAYDCMINLAALVFENNQATALTLQTILEATLEPGILDPNTFAPISEDIHSTGISVLNAGAVDLMGVVDLTVNGIDAKKFTARNCRFYGFGNGFRLQNVELYYTQSIVNKEGDFIACASEYYSNIIENGTSRGLLVAGCWCKITYNPSAPTLIRNNTTHGIEVKDNGFLWLKGAVAGTGNGSSGVYFHSKASIEIDHDDPPTLTGNSGTVDVTIDGATQKESWVNIAAGASIRYFPQLLLARPTQLPEPDFKLDFFQSMTPLKFLSSGSYTFAGRASPALRRFDGYSPRPATNNKYASIRFDPVDTDIPRAACIKDSLSIQAKGLLLESPGVTNVLVNPCDFTQNAWTKVGADVTSDLTLDAYPADMVTPISRLAETVDVAGEHMVSQAMGTIANNETASLTTMVRGPNTGRTYTIAAIFDGTTYVYVLFGTGTVAYYSYGITGGATLSRLFTTYKTPAPGFVNYGANYRYGWYNILHLVVRNVSGVSKDLTAQIYLATSTTWASRLFTGSASYPEGLYFWGTMGVLNPVSNDIPSYTHTSRAADGDLEYVAGDNFGGENIGKGTHKFFIYSPNTTPLAAQSNLFAISDGGDPNNQILGYIDVDGKLNVSTRKSGGNPGDVQLPTAINTWRRLECQLSWKANYLKLWIRDPVTDTLESAVDTECDIPLGLDKYICFSGPSKIFGPVTHYNECYEFFLSGE